MTEQPNSGTTLNLSPIPMPVDSLTEQLRAACILECTAEKSGNVHPRARFHDVSYADFLMSAEVIAPLLARSREAGVGPMILAAVQATIAVVGTNTNLGMLLLLAPLAAVPPELPLAEGIHQVLAGLDAVDTRDIYAAIRQAQPGGLGQAEHDVAEEPRIPILTAMAQAPQDRVARQYTHDFADVLLEGRNWFLESIADGEDWNRAILKTHLYFLANYSDSLIRRKCGETLAEEARTRARNVLTEWEQGSFPGAPLKDFDDWLRADGNRRNPGTTADLLAAVLFAAIRDRDWNPPARISPFPE